MKKKELREQQALRRSSKEDDLSHINNLLTSAPIPSSPSHKDSPDLQKQSGRGTSRPQPNNNLTQEGSTMNREDGNSGGLKQSAGVEIKAELKREAKIKVEDDPEPFLRQENVPKAPISSAVPTLMTRGTVLGKRTRENETDNDLAKRWKEMIQHQRSLIDNLERYVQTQGQVSVPPVAGSFLEASLKRLEIPQNQELVPIHLGFLETSRSALV
jgi:hypothetical protein